MIRYIYIIICSFVFCTTNLFAQPANDACAGAEALPTDGSCIPGTTAAATDNWIGTVGCQANNNVNEVWYTFTSGGTQSDITVTQGTMTGDVEIIMTESSGPCSGLVLNGSYCGPAAGPIVFANLSPGITYYMTINSTGADGSFTICNDITSPPPAPGLDCPTAAPLCNSDPFSQGSFVGIGVAEEISLNSCYGADERQSKWYSFTVDEGGSLEFLIDPNTDSDDYDWAVWNTTSGCYTTPTTMGTPIACNWSGCPGFTGILNPATDPCTVTQFNCANGPACNAGDIAQFSTSPPILVAGDTYTILIDNFSSSSGGFSFDWRATTADVGPDAGFTTGVDATCMTVSFDRLTNYTGPNMTYLWSFGDGNTSTDPVPSDYTYGGVGLYTISCEVTDALGCVTSFSRVVDIGCILLSSKLTSFEGSKEYKENHIFWSMETNEELSHFSLERSTDGIYWESIATINSQQGNSTNYQYIDKNHPLQSDNYYRLIFHNMNGNETHSDMIVLESDGQSLQEGLFIHNMYPSPVENELTLDVESGKEQYISIQLYNSLGQKIEERRHFVQANINQLSLDMSRLGSGVYLLLVSDEEKKITRQKRIVKK